MNKFICATAVAVIALGFAVAGYAQNSPQVTGGITITIPGAQVAPQPAPQPHNDHWERHQEIHAAIDKLEHAKEDLQRAHHDYGDHRDKALKHIDEALWELKAGVDYSNNHERW